MSNPKLYIVASKMKSEKYGELTIHWFVYKRPEERDCKPFVKNPNNIYDMNFANECFTAKEAKQLGSYLKRIHNDKIKKRVIETPIRGILAYGDIGEGGGHRLIVLSSEKEYDLPFKVHGHYYLFENTDPNENTPEDPDFDIKIKDGFVETAGGTPIGMTLTGIPINMILEHLGKLDKKDDEDKKE
jgi:hypothetical protein